MGYYSGMDPPYIWILEFSLESLLLNYFQCNIWKSVCSLKDLEVHLKLFELYRELMVDLAIVAHDRGLWV